MGHIIVDAAADAGSAEDDKRLWGFIGGKFEIVTPADIFSSYQLSGCPV